MKSIFVLFTLLFAAFSAVAQADLPEGVAQRTLSIDLGEGYISEAILTYPAEGDGPWPTVVLVHGSGPYDKDSTYSVGPGLPPLSANFRLLAEALPQQGIAVLRYDKRGVLADGQIDFAQVQASTLDRLVADAALVVEAALAQPEVGPLHLFGWSEGAWVITNLALQDSAAISSLIFMGGPDGDLGTVVNEQWLDLALPYLAEQIDSNQDGLLAVEELLLLQPGPVQYMGLFFLFDQTSTPDQPVLNRMVDANQDGLIDIEAELRTSIEQYLGNLPRFMPPTEASTDTVEMVTELDLPVLLLHGERDGWVALAHAERIAAAENARLIAYEGLGHALSPVNQPAEDSFGVMAEQPVADLIDWVLTTEENAE